MKKTKIKLNDYSRILISETAPLDVPIIFTNNWFYQNIKNKGNKDIKLREVIKYLFEDLSTEKESIPMRYKIRKDDTSYRHMGLMHPTAQINMVWFYRQYTSQIIHYCSKSSFSIRRPVKVASSFYFKNKFQNSKNLKGSSAQRLSDETKFKHATSYYAYDKHVKLHQFFESEEYFDLEGKYTQFWSIDISKCFDSIYTHSISWATKGKHTSKKTKSKDIFGTVFDRLMQRSNFNETNGILIGNEASRIFAEIILQEIDCRTKKSLDNEEIIEGIDYDVRRYVDDFFIFSSSEEIAQKVVNSIESNLRTFKLYINNSKTKKQQKPFITGVSRAKISAEKSLADLYDTLFEYNDEKTITIRKDRIRRTHSVVKTFINNIKSSCEHDKESYNVMTGYIISALLNKVKEIFFTDIEDKEEQDFAFYRDAFKIILKLSFHLFSVNPTFTNSIKLSYLCYISFMFFENKFKNEERTIKLTINGYIKDFFESGKCKKLLKNGDNYFPIEFANLLFIARNMGKDYLLNPIQIKEIFDLPGIKTRTENFIEQEENTDYFQLMSLLYYLGNEPEYSRIKDEAIKQINGRLTKANLHYIKKDAKLCFLFLDSISCPFIDEKSRKKWLQRFAESIPNSSSVNLGSINHLYDQLSSEQWFISWSYPDLWNTLEKKELLFEY